MTETCRSGWKILPAAPAVYLAVVKRRGEVWRFVESLCAAWGRSRWSAAAEPVELCRTVSLQRFSSFTLQLHLQQPDKNFCLNVQFGLIFHQTETVSPWGCFFFSNRLSRRLDNVDGYHHRTASGRHLVLSHGFDPDTAAWCTFPLHHRPHHVCYIVFYSNTQLLLKDLINMEPMLLWRNISLIQGCK